MLASPEPTAEAIWERFATELPDEVDAVYVEDKFDGIRAQLHRGSERVEIFSRDLRRITDQFDEIAEQARNFRDEVILDGEIMAFEHGKKLTFFDLQKRLGRKSEGADLFADASADVPVVFVAFDLALAERPITSRDAAARAPRTLAQPEVAAAISSRGSFSGPFRGGDRAGISKRAPAFE